MGKIFCLMGKSSSGKDTIYKLLMEQTQLPLKRIVPYTTRPMRSGEKDGVDYIFTDENGLEHLLEQGRVVEQRAYETVYGIWKYFTVDDGQTDLSRWDYLVIGTLEAFVQLREYYGKGHVLPIYIEVEDGVRLERALARERIQAVPKYAELCRRYLADEEDFSEEKLSCAGIERRFFNRDVSEAVKEILEYIKQCR